MVRRVGQPKKRKATSSKRAKRARKTATNDLLPDWRPWVEACRSWANSVQHAAVLRLERARRGRWGLLGALVISCLRILFILTLPFLVLVRGATWLYLGPGFPSWLALLGGALATLGVVTVYGVLVSRRFTGQARLGMIAKWVAAPMVLFYCANALLYVSRVNAKDDAVYSVYTVTHPLLRVAVSTLIMVDRNAVITDLIRTPDDYRRMGLRMNQRSLHYRQDDGWVHAMDLRVRGSFKSWLVVAYFRAMGFDTMRHVGTADHLHVSLPVT